MLNGDTLEYLHDLGKEWVGDLRNDEAEDPASSGNKGTRLSVGIIAKFFDDVPYALGELWIDSRNSIDGAGYRGGRNTGTLCDFANIHETGPGAELQAASRTQDDIKI